MKSWNDGPGLGETGNSALQRLVDLALVGEVSSVLS